MLPAIKSRRSIRSYQNKPVEDGKLKEILLAAFAAPSANHIYPWQFVIVKTPAIKEKLSKATKWCSFVKEAPIIIIVIGEAEKSREWIEDAGIVTENMFLEAVNQGLGSCFIQVRESKQFDGSDSEKYVKELLNIPKKLRVVFMLPIGYPAEQKEPHGETDYKSEKVHFEEYKNT